MNIGQLTAILQVNAAQLNLAAGALKKFETDANTSLNRVQLGLDKMSNSMKTIGTAMSIGLTLPIVGLGVAATKTFREYELNLAHIIGLTGTSREQTMQWSSQLMELSKATAQGPNKLADALYFIASSGIDDAEAMDVLSVSAKSAAAGLGDVNKVADLVTSALNAYKGTGLTAAMVTDQLTAAVREGKAEAPGFAEAIGYAIPIAAQLGVSFDQVAAAMASVSGVGVDVNTAALYLRQVLSDLLKPSHQAEQALNNMGTSSAKLREELANKGLLPLLRTLSVLTEKNGKTMAEVFPEVRSLTEVLALTGKNVGHVADIFDLVANSAGDMEKALIPVTETLDFKFRQAVTNSQLALISLGQALKGPVSAALNWIADAISDFTKWFSNLDPAMQGFIVTIAALVAAAGPLSLLISGLTYSINALIGAFASGAAPIAALVLGLGFLVAETIRAINYTSELDKIHNKFQQNIENESTNIAVLFGALEKTNGSSAIRKNIIDQINQQYGQYLPHLITEKTSLSELKQIEEDLNKTMIAGIALRAERESIESILNAQLKREKDFFSDIISRSEKMAKIAPMQSWTAALNDLAQTWPGLIDGFKGAGDAALELNKDGSYTVKTVADLANTIGISYDAMVNKLGDLLGARVQDKQSIEAITATYKSYEGTINNVNNALNKSGGKKTVGGVDVSGYSKAAEVIKDVQKQIDALNKIIETGDTVTNTAKEKVDIYTKGLKALSETTNATKEQLSAMQANLRQAFEDSVITDYLQTIEALNAKMQQQGYTSDLYEEALKAVNKALDDLHEKGITSGAAMDYLKYAFINTKPPIEKVSGALDLFIAKQVQAGKYSKELGDTMEETNSSMKDFGSALDNISGNNISGSILELSSSFDMLKEKYGSIWNEGGTQMASQDIAQFANNFVSVIQAMKDAVMSEFMDITNGVSDVINSLSGYVRQIKQNALDYVQSVADANEERIREIAESENKSQKWLSAQLSANQKELASKQDAINKAYGEKLKKYALLAAKINIAQGVTKAIAEKGILGIGQAALIYEAGRIQIKTIEATEFAHGGIVPPGYPNDSYPALLTSGEMVTPPGKLPEASPSMIQVVVKVDGMTKGEDLYHMLKEVETRIINSY